jgi:Zn-dependent protease
MNLEFGLISLVILIFSAILHEIAHGIIAERLGDPTARLSGRLTLNPIPHIDPYLSILLPLILIIAQSPVIFGGAKPVPVDPFNLRDGRKDLALVSLAGPATNFIIAIGFAGILHIVPLQMIGPFAYHILYLVVQLNLLLGIFNLVPIPPLDGSKIWTILLPERDALRFMNVGNAGFILIFAFLYLFGGVLGSLLSFALRLLGL